MTQRWSHVLCLQFGKRNLQYCCKMCLGALQSLRLSWQEALQSKLQSQFVRAKAQLEYTFIVLASLFQAWHLVIRQVRGGRVH